MSRQRVSGKLVSRPAILLAAGALLGQLQLPPSLEAAILAFLQALT